MRHGKLERLYSGYGDEWTANGCIYISLKYRYVYFENPLVGSGPIERALIDLEAKGLPMVPRQPHPEVWRSPLLKPYQIDPSELEEILWGDAFFRFSFVTDPFERLLFHYFRIVQPAGSNLPTQLGRVWWRRSGELQKPLSFIDYLRCISDIEDVQRSKHYRTQTRLLQHDKITLDFTGRLETFDQDIRRLANRLPLHDEIFQDVHDPATLAEMRASLFTEEAEAIAVSIYAADFETYGYSRSAHG